MVPVTGSAAVCTDTLVSLPRVAVTLIPEPGLTFVLPGAGEMASCTPWLAAAGPDVGPACRGLLPPDGVLAEHPAASAPASRQQMVIAAQRAAGLRRAENPGSLDLRTRASFACS
jgi:hypothetical protein